MPRRSRGEALLHFVRRLLEQFPGHEHAAREAVGRPGWQGDVAIAPAGDRFGARRHPAEVPIQLDPHRPRDRRLHEQAAADAGKCLADLEEKPCFTSCVGSLSNFPAMNTPRERRSAGPAGKAMSPLPQLVIASEPGAIRLKSQSSLIRTGPATGACMNRPLPMPENALPISRRSPASLRASAP